MLREEQTSKICCLRSTSTGTRRVVRPSGWGWSILWREEDADRWDWFTRKKPELNTKSRFGFWCPLDSPTGVGVGQSLAIGAPRTGPTVTQGFFSRVRTFWGRSAPLIKGVGANFPLHALPDNITATNSVCCRLSVRSAPSLLLRGSKCDLFSNH